MTQVARNGGKLKSFALTSLVQIVPVSVGTLLNGIQLGTNLCDGKAT